MSMKKLVTEVTWCKGCGICAAFCPRHVLIKDEVSCIKCGQCELRCPDYAIWLQEVDHE